MPSFVPATRQVMDLERPRMNPKVAHSGIGNWESPIRCGIFLRVNWRLSSAIVLNLGVAFSAAGRIGAAEADEVWSQAEAKKMVQKVLEVEGAEKSPWNRIPWRANVSNAVEEARAERKPLFVFFFTAQPGAPHEPCGPEGRLLRGLSLSDSTVLSLIKTHFIPVKLKLEKGKPFPVTWPALERWANAYKFSNEHGFAGCSVVSPDLYLEYANSGPATIGRMLGATAFDPKAFADMLERAEERVTEERSLKVQRRVSDYERKMEVHRFREGVSRAVRSEGGSRLPPKGYTLDGKLELYRMLESPKSAP